MNVNEFLLNYYLMRALDGKTADEITKEFLNEVREFADSQRPHPSFGNLEGMMNYCLGQWTD